MSYSLIAAADVRTPMTDREEFARFKMDGEGYVAHYRRFVAIAEVRVSTFIVPNNLAQILLRAHCIQVCAE